MIKRRNFLKQSAAVGAASVAIPHILLASKTPKATGANTPDVVKVYNGEPGVMVDKALAALGGIGLFVKKGQTVVVKPNMSWIRPVENGANTNPAVVKRVIEHCIQAGAKKVLVLDHTVDKAPASWKTSKIGPAVKAAGGVIVPASEQGKYQKTTLKGAKVLKERAIHEAWLEADAIINLPVLKHHKTATITAAIKNLMGTVWNRRAYHAGKTKNAHLHQNIGDFCTLKKPVLNIIDAYRVTTNNGPHRAKPEDVVVRKTLFASPDIVAADAAATKFFGLDPAAVGYIKVAHELKIGNMDLTKQKIREIKI